MNADGDGADAGPISLMARDCRNLFVKWEKRLEKDSRLDDLDVAAEYYETFEASAAYLGVFSGKLASLDYRLRRHPSIQDLVMRLLDILRHNLFYGEVLPGSWVACERNLTATSSLRCRSGSFTCTRASARPP